MVRQDSGGNAAEPRDELFVYGDRQEWQAAAGMPFAPACPHHRIVGKITSLVKKMPYCAEYLSCHFMVDGSVIN